MRALILLLPALLTACGSEPSEEESAARDARAIAMAENAQRPPPLPIKAVPIPAAAIEKYALSAPGCGFLPRNRVTNDPVMITQAGKGHLLVGGELMTFAADSGSPQIPAGAQERYVGRGYSLQLTSGPGEGEPAGPGQRRWPASLAITDAYERIVYFAAGSLKCGT